MYDIFLVSLKKVSENSWQNFKLKYPTAQKIENVVSFEDVRSKSFTKMFWVVWDDVMLVNDFDLNSYRATKWDDMYVHVFLNGVDFDGVALFPKSIKVSSKEFSHRFYLEKKEIKTLASTPRPYDKFYIDSYEEYEKALELSSSDMFWGLSYNLNIEKSFNFNLYFSHHNAYDRNQNHAFIHRVNDVDLYNGVFLFSKNKKLSKKEIDFRFPIEKKEWPIVASGPVKYDRFVIKDYKDYLDAFNKSKTEMFYIIPNEVQSKKGFNFDIYFSHDNKYDRSIHHGFKHIFRNEETYNGITLVTKQKKLSKREIDFRFIIEKKEWNLVASFLKPYDIIFISYNEPNADENFDVLQKRFPRAKRVHGVKGIHRAHIKAAELSETDMFYVVDGDAKIQETFLFNYEVPIYERDTVHVWRSQNPINDLEYGYGGVKLLPRDLTLSLDTSSADMTTSISNKFKILKEVSNVSIFNVDEFSTWRSAFRECAKLASKTIQGQIDNETEQRLKVWTTVGKDRKFGEYAIDGAIAGQNFGYLNRENTTDLRLINDFEWLEQKFKESKI